MTIKHLVISGGGPTFISSLGIIQELDKKKFLEIKNIESIYATSAGSIVALLLSLQFDWDTLNNYIINRPWHEIFKIDSSVLISSFREKGLFNIDITKKCFLPLFNAKNISIDTTLLEFYNYNHIELHVFSLNINIFELEDISYITHPNLKVIEAIHMSCTVPLIFSPICFNKKCNIDGGIICNYPKKYCVKKYNNLDEIFGIKNSNLFGNNIINNESSILDYIFVFFQKILSNLTETDSDICLKYEINCNANNIFSLSHISETIYDVTIRRTLLNNGIEAANQYILNNSI